MLRAFVCLIMLAVPAAALLSMVIFWSIRAMVA